MREFRASGLPRLAGMSFLLLLSNCWSMPAWAVEVDDIAASYAPLSESGPVLDQYVNEMMEKAASNTKGCGKADWEKNLYASLSASDPVSRLLFGGVENFASSSKQIQRSQPEIESSIYQNTPLTRAVVMVGGKAFRVTGIFPSIRLQGEVIGVDKLSHFFETGHELYDHHLRAGAEKETVSLAEWALLQEEAIRMEEDWLGWTVSGIKSYGDLVAHTQGSLFWREVLSEKSSWWECSGGKIELKRKFRFADFAGPAWSEAINCSEYVPDPELTYLKPFYLDARSFAAVVAANAEALKKKTGQNHQCPLRATGCEEAAEFLRAKFPKGADISPFLSPSCR